MKQATRPVFDVGNEVLIRDLTPWRQEDYEIRFNGETNAQYERRYQQPGPCQCLECRRHRKTQIARER